jgi:hypothetical protein
MDKMISIQDSVGFYEDIHTKQRRALIICALHPHYQESYHTNYHLIQSAYEGKLREKNTLRNGKS